MSITTRRIKVTVPDLSMDDIVRITGEISAAHHALAVDTEQMNRKLDAVKAGHQERQTMLAAEIKSKTELLERWASANPQAFGERRSIDLPRAVVGFRLSNPSVKPTKGMGIADIVEHLLREPGGDRFVRMAKPELDKPAILAEREALSDLFARCGIKIVQEERFFIEPKSEQPAEALM